MKYDLQQMYTRALALREPWMRRWNDARRYTMPTSDSDLATLFDATASSETVAERPPPDTTLVGAPPPPPPPPPHAAIANTDVRINNFFIFSFLYLNC